MIVRKLKRQGAGSLRSALKFRFNALMLNFRGNGKNFGHTIYNLPYWFHSGYLHKNPIQNARSTANIIRCFPSSFAIIKVWNVRWGTGLRK